MSQQFWIVLDVELNPRQSMTTNTDTPTHTTMIATITTVMVTVTATAMTKEIRRIYLKNPLNQILSLVTVIERDLSLACVIFPPTSAECRLTGASSRLTVTLSTNTG